MNVYVSEPQPVPARDIVHIKIVNGIAIICYQPGYHPARGTFLYLLRLWRMNKKRYLEADPKVLLQQMRQCAIQVNDPYYLQLCDKLAGQLTWA